MAFRKSFGNLAEVSYEFRDCGTVEEYSDYAASIAQAFLNNPRVNAKVISCPKDEITMQKIIVQAVRSIRPFRTAKANGKEYTDAGFKDALIFNTILNHTEDQLGILISNDGDFSELFNEASHGNLRICSTVKEVQMILSREFNIVTINMIEGILGSDSYLMQRILSECQLDENAQVSKLQIMSCKTVEDSVYVQFTALTDGIKQLFDITYNINANELLEASCELFEEGESG